MKKKIASGLAVGALALTVMGCASTASDSAPQAAETAASFNQELHDMLPDEIKDAGEMTGVMISFPPYVFFEEDGTTLQGASIDLAQELSDLLGVDVKPEIVPAFSQAITGLTSSRYDFGLGPYADNPSTQETFDFVDWIQEFVVFAVQKGNPAGIDGLESTCGASIAVLAGGSAEAVLNEQNTACGSEGIDIQAYEDGNAAILAVQSGRADAYFSSQASLVHFINQTDGALELAGTEYDNGFSNLRQGSFLPKDSELTPVILAAFEELQANGTLGEVMDTWGLADNEVEKVGLNLSLEAQ